MSSMIEWLKEMEDSAAELYAAASRRFVEDPAFSAFLWQLAEEERWHRKLIGSLPAGGGNAVKEELTDILDQATCENISGLLTAGMSRLAAGGMSREAMLETIAAVEFSEWNDIFLYVLHALRRNGPEYQAAVAEIERHKGEISKFLASDSTGSRYLETVQRLPEVGGKRILIVEKNQALGRLLRSIVAAVGDVELVESGLEGLARLEKEQFDVVISDLNMQSMSSRAFYAVVTERYPEMKDRFIFFVGGPLGENQEPLASDEAVILDRAEMTRHLRRTVADIAHRARVFH